MDGNTTHTIRPDCLTDLFSHICDSYFVGETIVLYFESESPAWWGCFKAQWELINLEHSLVPYRPYRPDGEWWNPLLPRWALVHRPQDLWILSKDPEYFDPKNRLAVPEVYIPETSTLGKYVV